MAEKSARSAVRSGDVDIDRDRALVERCQGGDAAAFEVLYLRYRERLFRACRSRLNSTSEAEDVVQEAFARAWKAMPGFEGERRFYPWLSVIANNLCTDVFRKRRRCTPTDDSDLSLVTPASPCEQERLVDSAGDAQTLHVALGRLSPRHREVLELREQKNWTYQQIAAHSGVEVSTIETLLFRARRALRREFLTLVQAESGLPGILAFPLVLFRRMLRRAAHHLQNAARASGADPGAFGAKFASIVAGAAIAITAVVATVPLAGSHARPVHVAPAPGGHFADAATTWRAPARTPGGAGRPVRALPHDLGRQGAASRGARPNRAAAAQAAGSGGVSTDGGAAGMVAGVGQSVSGIAAALSGLTGTVRSGLSSSVSGTVSTVSGVAGSTASGVGSTASGVAGTASGVAGTVSGVAGTLTAAAGTVSGLGGPVGPIVLP